MSTTHTRGTGEVDDCDAAADDDDDDDDTKVDHKEMKVTFQP
jgi:hypothetical protein